MEKNYDSIAKMYGGQSDDYDKLAQQFGAQVIEAERMADQAMMTHKAAPKDNFGTAKDIPLGMLKGASDIGRTALYPIDATSRFTGVGMNPEQRKQAMSQFFSENANPDSLLFKTGEIGTQVAGTAGVGGVLAKTPMLATNAPRFAQSLKTSGFSIGAPSSGKVGAAKDITTRVAGGGITGGAMTGMVNPEDYKTGVLLGSVLPGAVKVAGKTGQLVRKGVKEGLGASTGAGPEAISTAYKAGKEGKTAFVKHMRGEAPFVDVVEEAKLGLSRMRADRANVYRSGMVDITNDKSVIDMKPILDEIQNIQSMGTYKGQVVQKNASATVQEISEKVNEWANLDPTDFHTPEGLDKLKQAIGDIREGTQVGTSARRAADQAYNAVKAEITKQAPTYSKVMRDYQEASDTLDEVTRTLSLGEKASADTSIRKLQSLLRNNAQTNYGNRLNLANELETKGGVDLMTPLAGQSLNSMMPRGISGAFAKIGFPGVAITNTATLPALALAAPLFSPRTMGEALYSAGSMARLGNKGLLNMNQTELPQLARALPIILSTNPLSQQQMLQQQAR